MSSPRVTRAFLVLGLGVLALVGCTTRQEPAPTPTPGVTQAPAGVLPTLRPRPGLSLRLAGGDVGSETNLRVSGVACSGGQPLTVVWDTLRPVAQLEGVSDASQIYEIRITAPKDQYGSHSISVRCGLDGPLLATTRFLLTNAPVVTVDPISALPGTPLEINLTGFSCVNDFNRPETTVITWGGTPISLPFAVPPDTRPGRYTVVARCDWPDGTAPPQATTTVWVPGIVGKPTSGVGGTNVQVTGIGFNCGDVALDIDHGQAGQARVRVDRERQGLFTAAVPIPAGAAAGPHYIGATCTDAGARPVAVFTVVGPTASPSRSEQPKDKGTQPVVWVTLGGAGLVILAALGVAGYLARRAARPRPRRPGLRIQVGLGEPQVQVREVEERQ